MYYFTFYTEMKILEVNILHGISISKNYFERNASTGMQNIQLTNVHC